MNKITVSAPGKLMLFGEHAVVYGRPCIVTAVGQKMRATVELTEKPIFEINAPDVQVVHYQKPMSDLGGGTISKGAKFVEMAVRNFLANTSKESEPTFEVGIKVTTKSEFSSQFGFGSSSASTVCVIKALSELIGKKLSNKQIFDLAYKTVLDIQGKGSGFDVAAAVYGGTLYFVTPGKVIKPLKIKSLPLIVGYSGIKADTVTLINQVLEKAKKYPQVVDDVYTGIGKIVDSAKKALLQSDWQTLGELMNINEGYLRVLEVEGGKLSSMIYAAREAGAYGAKLSGAGMGDCMVCLAPPKFRKAVEKAIGAVNIEANVEGVKIEK